MAEIQKAKEVLTYDQALEKTFHKGTAKFQVVSIFLLLASLYGKFPLVGGISYLEKVPNKFECYQVTSQKMNTDAVGNWKSCT